ASIWSNTESMLACTDDGRLVPDIASDSCFSSPVMNACRPATWVACACTSAINSATVCVISASSVVEPFVEKRIEGTGFLPATLTLSLPLSGGGKSKLHAHGVTKCRARYVFLVMAQKFEIVHGDAHLSPAP